MSAAAPLSQMNDPKFTIIILDESCLDEISQFLATCDDFSMLVSGQPHQPDEAFGLLHDLPPERSIEDKQVLGIRDASGKLSGVLDLVRGYPQESVCFIGLFLLLPECRGKGLGGQVMRSVAESARQQGFQALMLGVVEENQAGIRFWKTCGFQLVEKSQPRTFGQKTQCVLRMQKTL